MLCPRSNESLFFGDFGGLRKEELIFKNRNLEEYKFELLSQRKSFMGPVKKLIGCVRATLASWTVNWEERK